VLGIAPEAAILPIKDGGAIGSGIVRAIQWATDHGARVICVAQGQPDDIDGLDAAIADAERADIVVVAAAGNVSETNVVNYPAADPGVVAVAGTDEHGNHATVSVTGHQIVLAAPATNIVQPYPDHKYAVGSGTSASAAIVAGAAALIRSRFPNLSAVEVIHRLTATARDSGSPGRDDEYGYGLINIAAALSAHVATARSPLQSSISPSADRTSGIPTNPSAGGASPTAAPAGLGLLIAVSAVAAAVSIWLVTRIARHRS
jgi:subtilisin family serine protease